MSSVKASGTPWLSDSISLVIRSRPLARSGSRVGGDHPLVDPPGRLDLDVVVAREQIRQPLPLLVGEQVGAGVQRPAGR
jgi:hypothetical protein